MSGFDTSAKAAGIKEAMAALKVLPDRCAKRVYPAAVRAGAASLLKEARKRVPVRSGALKKALTMVMRKPKNPDYVEARVGFRKVREVAPVSFVDAVTGKKVRKKKTALKSPSRRAHLTEFGTGPRVQANGKSVGASPAKPFMRPALAAGAPDAAAAAIAKLGEGIAKEAERFRSGGLRYDGRILK